MNVTHGTHTHTQRERTRAREREKERERDAHAHTHGDRERERECVCVCVCVSACASLVGHTLSSLYFRPFSHRRGEEVWKVVHSCTSFFLFIQRVMLHPLILSQLLAALLGPRHQRLLAENRRKFKGCSCYPIGTPHARNRCTLVWSQKFARWREGMPTCLHLILGMLIATVEEDREMICCLVTNISNWFWGPAFVL